jgi:hypothetical protein
MEFVCVSREAFFLECIPNETLEAKPAKLER